MTINKIEHCEKKKRIVKLLIDIDEIICMEKLQLREKLRLLLTS